MSNSNGKDRFDADAPESMKDIQRLLRGAVGRAAERSVEPFFVDRVMKSVAGSRPIRLAGEDFFDALVAWFRPVAVASVIIIAVLVGHNIKSASDYELAVSVSESVLGLPPVSVETAYELEDE